MPKMNKKISEALNIEEPAEFEIVPEPVSSVPEVLPQQGHHPLVCWTAEALVAYQATP